MKYIVVEVTQVGIVRELPFIFPEAFVHKSMFEYVQQEYLSKYRADSVRCVGAGFINSVGLAPAGGCHGESESLGVKSRGELDDKLISSLDYTHGIRYEKSSHRAALR